MQLIIFGAIGALVIVFGIALAKWLISKHEKRSAADDYETYHSIEYPFNNYN